MKPRSLFDNPDAWVAATFKRPPRPRSFVTLPKPKSKLDPKLMARKVAEPPVPFPPSEQTMPYQTGCSPAVRQTIQAVAARAGVPMAQIVGERRTGEIAIIRHIAVWIARKFTNRSLIAIASEVGGRHHTTIMHGIRCIDKLIKDLGITVPEETPEAWTGALLAGHAAQKRLRDKGVHEPMKLFLPYPPSANARMTVNRAGTMILKPGYKIWMQEAAWVIALAMRDSKLKMITGPYRLDMIAMPPLRSQVRDLDNIVKATSDALKKGGAIEDDRFCQKLTLAWGELDEAGILIEIEACANRLSLVDGSDKSTSEKGQKRPRRPRRSPRAATTLAAKTGDDSDTSRRG